jgi:8-oxo-dGTP pyrophosphatase MutT (NUDIX family)
MKIICGVGLLLREPAGKVLILRELQSKPHYGKYAGMLTLPFETIEDGETTYDALRRLIHEEIGVEIVEIAVDLVSFKEFFIELSGDYSAQLFVFTGTVTQQFIACPNDTDVEYYDWMSPQDILRLDPRHRRQEVVPIFDAIVNAIAR